MSFLTIDTVNVVDSSNIEISFSSNLVSTLNTSNVFINVKGINTPKPEVIKVKVNASKLYVTCQPLTPYAVYELNFISTLSSPFSSVNGNESLSEDGTSNIYLFSGPPNPDNPFRDLFKNYLRENIYNVDDQNTIVGKLIESYSKNFLKCLSDVALIKNENYISTIVENEEKIRGSGPFDRLDEGGAYQILRVAKTPSSTDSTKSFLLWNKRGYFDNEVDYFEGDVVIYNDSTWYSRNYNPANSGNPEIGSKWNLLGGTDVRTEDNPTGFGVSGSYQIDYFPNYPINLQSNNINYETLSIDSIDAIGKFNINSLILNLKNNNVIKIKKIIFVLGSFEEYYYPIDQLGYQISDNKYDQEYAFKYYNLTSNQVKLNDVLIKSEIIDLESIISVKVDYEYKDLGKIINPDTLIVTNNLISSRETIPPIINIFDLKYSPIVNSNNIIPQLNGVLFTDPNNINLNAVHPAFSKEIVFDLNFLPNTPGQYSVDYMTGRVYVYGENALNTGTGSYPPVATYQYRLQYQDNIDYVFDTDNKDIVALPNGSLINNKCRINFKYEKVLVPDVDYVSKPHQESLQERIGNRLLDLGTLRTLNKPVTNVFRIYNETSGEIYSPIRWDDDKIYFRYNIPPEIKENKFERVNFKTIVNELLSINSITLNSYSNRVFKILLKNNNITSKSEDCIGSSFNSSVMFSNVNLFKLERYFNAQSNNPENILQNIGEYCIDYINGIIYCSVSSSQDYDIGTISYKINKIETSYSKILSVDDIYYQISPLSEKGKIFNYSSFDETDIIPLNLDKADETCYQNNSTLFYQLKDKKVGYYATYYVGDLITIPVDNFINSGGQLITVEDIDYQLNQTNIDANSFLCSVPGVSFDGVTGTINVPAGTPLNYSTEPFETNYNAIRLSITYSYSIQEAFQEKVSNPVKNVRYIFEQQDLINNIYPINFYQASSFSNSTIAVDQIKETFFDLLLKDSNNDFYVYLPYKSSYISPNLNFNISVKSATNGNEFWDASGQIIIENDQLKLILSGSNSPSEFEQVQVSFSIEINDLSSVVVDYDRGGLYVDYSFIVDELLVSYEYGEDVIDFRQSKAVSTGETYYVTYRVGAMRDALLNNFGSLLNIKELNQFNVNLDREGYRDCISAALTSFLQGPTSSAIKNLVNKITHVNPEVIESVFNTWSLGDSLLHPNQIKSTGEFSLVPLKFNNGVLINQEDQSISLPQSSNISFQQGTFETWILPEWNGIDNQSDLTIKVLKNGYPVSKDSIFIGLDERYPNLNNNSFTINKNNYLHGEPQKNKNGIYFYYAPDQSGLFDRWYAEVVDNQNDGDTYFIEIKSSGKFYDFKKIINPDTDIVTTTLSNKISVKIINRLDKAQVVTFICDRDKYIVDTGEINKNRLSIYKEPSGYLTFRVIDNQGQQYSISHDISSWERGKSHFISASWKLNSYNNADEMHLFIDGLEVPNHIKYGQRLLPYPHQKFKTLSQEVIVGSPTFDIVGSNDLTTTLDGYATSSVSINAYDVDAGDIIYVDDPLFDPNGYIITQVYGNGVKVNSFPAALKNLNYSINKSSFNLKLDAAVYSNISISTLENVMMGSDLETNAGSPIVTSTSSNFTNINPGFIFKIDGFDSIYTILSISGNNLILDKNVDISSTGSSFFIYSNEEKELPGQRSLSPYYNVSLDENFNSVLTITNGVKANDLIILNTYGLNFQSVKTKQYLWSDSSKIHARLPSPISVNSVKVTKILDSGYTGSGSYMNIDPDQPSNSDVGRNLIATISGTNADFSNPIIITIDGSNPDGPVTESIEFIDYDSLEFDNKYQSIDTIDIQGSGKFAFEIKEKYPVTYNDDGALFAAIKSSDSLGDGTTLERSSTEANVVIDNNKFFSKSLIGNTLTISSPFIGNYKIIDVSNDGYSLTLDTSLSSFSDGHYVVRSTLDLRSGIRNGQFSFEQFNSPGTPYSLNKGTYEIKYESYLSVKIDPSSNEDVYFGSDILKGNQANSVLDQIKIYSSCLLDTRIKETVNANQRSITKDYNSLIPLKADSNTLALIDFNTFPFLNQSDYYIKNIGKKYIQSDNSINNYFNKSLLMKDSGFYLDNYGILDCQKESTIEFWVNPIYDVQNDPYFRYYFDAFSGKTIKATSLNNCQVKIDEPVSEILSVTLEHGDSSIDYFAGGSIQLSNSGAIEAIFQASGNGEYITLPSNYPSAFQVISVRLENDLLNKDYFKNGVIDKNNRRVIYLEDRISNFGSNKVIVTYKPINGSTSLNTQVINLNRKLPKDNSSVIVNFIPKGFKGDRVSIFKDPLGFLNFKIFADNQTHGLSFKINWSKNTWHRVKATFKVNGKNNTDEMRLFIDGFEVTDQLIKSRIASNSYSSKNIFLKDFINQVYIGSDYSNSNTGYCLLNNLRISNISRPIYSPYGQSIDVAYGTNLNAVMPVIKDLYTTYLLDIDSSIIKNDNFASIILKILLVVVVRRK